MNKFFFFILFFAISLSYIFEIDKVIARNFNPFESIKRWYIQTTLDIQETSKKYFEQINTIEKLKEEKLKLRNYQILYEESKNKLDSTLSAIDAIDTTTQKIIYTKVLSYVDFENYTRVWLDLEKKDNQILALISDNYAAGIVINQDGRAEALLNGNEKCNYAVFIGKNRAPGIIHPAKKGKNIIAKYVPIWLDIQEGDEVITSGMDNIFFEGLKVGKVVSIKKKQDIQEATIVPYAKVLKQKSFFVYKKIIQEEEEKEEEEKTTK